MLTEEIETILEVAGIKWIYELDKRIYNLELTEEQLIDLFNIKRFFQDQLGVHYNNSSWNQLQDKDFINDIINYVVWYWRYFGIEKYLERIKNYPPHDFLN